MRAHTITTPRPAVLLSLLALGALGLLVGGGAGQSAAAIPAATGTQAITTLETTITKHPPKGKVVRTKTATFEFTANQPGATFECAVVMYVGPGAHETPLRKPFAPCTSPHRVKVGNGKHVFKVRATVGGVTDDTPARATWHACAGC
jgi:large repetitive protein